MLSCIQKYITRAVRYTSQHLFGIEIGTLSIDDRVVFEVDWTFFHIRPRRVSPQLLFVCSCVDLSSMSVCTVPANKNLRVSDFLFNLLVAQVYSEPL